MVHFGEEKTSLIKILESLTSARRIDLCMYLFTLSETAQFLIKLKRRGARVRVITDAGRESMVNDQIPTLKAAGIEVREQPIDRKENNRPLMHHKFVIIDDKICFMGSFNWTIQAVKKNYESVIKLYNPEIVKQFVREFNRLWNSLPHQAPLRSGEFRLEIE